MAMALSVTLSRVDKKEQAKSISNIESQNPSLQARVKILCVSWRIKMLKRARRMGLSS
jgi:hypothetical protein